MNLAGILCGAPGRPRHRVLRRSQPLTRVQEAYGRAARAITGRQDLSHVYENSRIVFQTSADDRVLGWMVYWVK